MMLPDFMPGDVLLYRGDGLLSQIIRLKTWSDVSHAELYVKPGFTVTAKLLGGVNYYPVGDAAGLVYVYRPRSSLLFNADRAGWMFDKFMRGQRYDTFGLVSAFYAAKSGARDRAFCSETVTRVLRYGGIEPFAPDFDADHVAPAQFKQTPVLTRVWSREES